MWKSTTFAALKKSELHKFVRDNTISTTCKSLHKMIDIFEQESVSSVSWFRGDK